MKRVKLREISKVVAGQAAPKEFSEGGYPFIRAGHLEKLLGGMSLKELPKISEEVANKKRLKLLPKGSVIFAKSGMSATKNRVYITNEEAYLVSHLAAILPNNKISNKFLSRYLFWYNPSKLILDNAYPSIRLEDINNLKIPLPPLLIQKKIAVILDQADALRQLDKKLIQKYEELSQSLFLNMFGDLNHNKRHHIGRVEDLIEIVRDGPHVSPKYSDSGVPILSTRNIRPFELLLDEVKYVSKDMYLELTRRFKPQKGDVLLTKGGTTGYAKLVDWDWSFCIWVHLASLRVDQKKANPKYLESALNSFYGYQQSQRYTRGIANKDLGLKRMIKIEIPFPPLNLQNQFAERAQAIEIQKAIAQQSLQKSENLFNSLLQKAFKGELVT